MDDNFSTDRYRVAMILPEGRWSGPIKRALSLYDDLSKSGVEVVFFVPANKVGDRSISKLEGKGVQYSLLPFDSLVRKSLLNSASNFLLFFSVVDAFKKEFVKYGIDIIHVNGPLVWQAVVAAKKLGIPSVTHFNDVAYPSPLPFLSSLFAAKYSSMQVATSDAVSEYYGLLKEAPVIPPPVARPDIELLESMRFPDEFEKTNFNICMLGNVNPLKGYEYIIEAMNLVCLNMPDCDIVVSIVGGVHETQDEYFAKLSEAIESYGLVDKINFIGLKGDPWPYLAHSDLFVHTAVSEAWSMSVAEAASISLPIIAFDSGGVSELLSYASNSHILSVGDANGLAQAILEVRAKNTSNIRENENITERFSIEKIAKQWLELYCNTMKKAI